MTDLAHLLLPHLPLLLTTLIRLTAPSPLHSANPHILQRVYDVLGALFRDLGRDILAAESKEDPEDQEGGLHDVWEVVRRGLGAPARSEEEDVEESESSKDEMEVDEEKAAEASEYEDEDEVEEPIASTSAQPIVATEPRVTLYRTLPRNFRTTPQTRRLLGNSFSYLVRKAKPTSLPDASSELSVFFDFVVQDVAEVEESDGGERPRGRGAKGRGKGKGKGRGQEEGNSNIFAEGVTWVVAESCTVCPEFLALTRYRELIANVILRLRSDAEQLAPLSNSCDPAHPYLYRPLARFADRAAERDRTPRNHLSHLALLQDGAARACYRGSPEGYQ